MRSSYLFTSESVSEGHPDKVADQISDAIVDLFLAKDPEARIACETLCTTQLVVLAGEIRCKGVYENGQWTDGALEEIEATVRATVKKIGYEQDGFHWESFRFENHLHGQSAHIAKGVDASGNKDEGAGDQGIMFGYATTETADLMPAPLYYAHGLLRRITISQQRGGVEVNSLISTYRNIKINSVLKDSQFVFTPAPGQVSQDAPKEPEYFDARLKTGAAPLPFAGKDLAGKPVNLAQYKGKVVLIDFWATWCAPCIEELPNIVTAYNRYKAKGFDVVGVSLDEAEDKSKLVKFTSNNKMPWRQVFDGKGMSSKLATGYGITAVPFTLLIGRDGKIAAVNPRGPELEPAVTAALAAK